MRACVYVDGFNLFYGIREHSRRGISCKWLDIDLLVRRLVRGVTISRIRYFTALLQARPGNQTQILNQQVYLRALRTIPHLSVHLGSFLTTSRVRVLVNPPETGATSVEVWHTEEKGSDVNLASYLLVDSFAGDFDLAVVISNDSDLCTPISMVRSLHGRDVIVLNPRQKPSAELQKVASAIKPIRAGALGASQFPPTLRDAAGTITRPAGW